MTNGDTIVAIASGVEPSGRIIVRSSGPQAHELARSVGVERIESSVVTRAWLRFDGLECAAWVYAFSRPRSATGEDVVEYHLPGNAVLGSMLERELRSRGARAAGPGEFTARAFFNGRIDLAEAEGVAAVIAAHSDRELRAARQLLGGELSRRLRPWMSELAESLALVEVGIDFSDEDVTFIEADALRARLERLNAELQRLLGESVRFERLSHEPRVALVGRPNAGKSTLLNRLAGVERAVVSDVAGTTRDALSARVTLRRGTVTLVDLAGLDDPLPGGAHGSSSDWPTRQIEQAMRETALRESSTADVLVLVRELGDERPSLPLPREPDLVVRTKADLRSPGQPVEPCVSAVTGEGMDRLTQLLDATCFGPTRSGGELLALTARHVAAIEQARDAVGRARELVGQSPELVALELREALDQLGSILGAVTADDLLGLVFSKFCIGK